ncbi:MAG: hypothetical protein R6T92_13630 [Desulfosalsimonadaceae bacterium]
MENLFFLLVVLVIIVSNVINIRKRLRKQQSGQSEAQGDEKQALTGWRKSVEKFLEQVREEFEPIPDDPSAGRPPGGDEENFYGEMAEKPNKMDARRPSEGEAARPSGRGYRMGETKRAVSKGVGKDENDSWQKPAGSPIETQRAPEYAAEPGEKTFPGDLPARAFSSVTGDAYSVAQLQRAVIWSEILGAPVSLRKGGQEPWLQ